MPLHLQRGQGMTEYLLVLVVLLSAFAGGAYAVVKYPDLANKTLLVAIAGAIIAGISWSVKQTISIVNARAQLLIYELLSKHQSDGLTRQEIDRTIRAESSVFRFVPGLTLDALAHLVSQKQVVASNGYYMVTEKKEGAKESSFPIRLQPSMRNRRR